MLENGYVRIYRSIVNWEWYQDGNTARVFLHLIFTVNYEPQKWRGIVINRGQRVASYQTLADELRLSVQNIRTALKHLISTGEVTHETTSEYGLFTVNNYDKFQELTDKTTDNQQTGNTQPTGDQQLWNKAKKAKKEKEYNNKQSSKSSTNPTVEENKYIVDEIVDYLNVMAGKKFSKTVAETQKFINGRLSDGRTLEDLKYVVDVKCEEWLDTDMEKYIRPSTLFCPSNFDKYINQKLKNLPDTSKPQNNENGGRY